jgi:hypothetical protein
MNNLTQGSAIPNPLDLARRGRLSWALAMLCVGADLRTQADVLLTLSPAQLEAAENLAESDWVGSLDDLIMAARQMAP